MIKTTYSVKAQIKHCEIFLKYWKTIPKENVAKNLSVWRRANPSRRHTCNTIACAGGWLPAMSEFKAMGIKADKIDGRPEALDNFGNILDAGSISHRLFGDSSLFYARNDNQLGTTRGSDHEIVTRRFKHQLKTLNSKL